MYLKISVSNCIKHKEKMTKLLWFNYGGNSIMPLGNIPLIEEWHRCACVLFGSIRLLECNIWCMITSYYCSWISVKYIVHAHSFFFQLIQQ